MKVLRRVLNTWARFIIAGANSAHVVPPVGLFAIHQGHLAERGRRKHKLGVTKVCLKGLVHGRVITNGAVTGRMTHMKPNMAQIPNSGSPYGPECRQCWTVDEGNVLVGCDASGLELRMLAHYMKDKDYVKTVTEV